MSPASKANPLVLFKSYYLSWLQKRNPRSRSVELNQKRIFIFPSKTGFLFVALLLLIFVNAINYKNNLLFALCFLLTSVFVTAILHTYRNFSGLKLEAGNALPKFVGDTLSLSVQLNAERLSRHGIEFGFNGDISVKMAHLEAREKTAVKIPLLAQSRGWLETPRLKLRSDFPLGIIRCWSWLYFDFKVLIYPKPVYQPYKYYSAMDGAGEEIDQGDATAMLSSIGMDDFRGFKSYQKGDAIRHIAWKQYAKSGELLIKEFEDTHEGSHWLDWRALSGLDVESRLQILCGWVLQSHEDDMEFGLKLPDQVISLARGDHQRDVCLQALAEFRLSKESSYA